MLPYRNYRLKGRGEKILNLTKRLEDRYPTHGLPLVLCLDHVLVLESQELGISMNRTGRLMLNIDERRSCSIEIMCLNNLNVKTQKTVTKTCHRSLIAS